MHIKCYHFQGVSYYEAMLKNLQNTYSFQLEDFLDHNVLPPETLSRQVKLALLSAQRTMICLGDVARYREQTNRTTNYGKARRFVIKKLLLTRRMHSLRQVNFGFMKGHT